MVPPPVPFHFGDWNEQKVGINASGKDRCEFMSSRTTILLHLVFIPTFSLHSLDQNALILISSSIELLGWVKYANRKFWGRKKCGKEVFPWHQDFPREDYFFGYGTKDRGSRWQGCLEGQRNLCYGGRRKRRICGYCFVTWGSANDQFKLNKTETVLALGILKHTRRHTLTGNVGERSLTWRLSREDSD